MDGINTIFAYKERLQQIRNTFLHLLITIKIFLQKCFLNK